MFSYFVPQSVLNQYAGVSTLIGVTSATLDRLKLGYVGPVTTKQISLGPSGSAGWLLYRNSPGAIDSYDANSQVWQSMPYPSDFYIGQTRSPDVMNPASLARESMLPGHPVRLGDGQQWNIPCAVDFDENGNMDCRLPRNLKILSDGTWSVGSVIPTYRQLWDYLESYLDAESMAVDGHFVFTAINDWCTAALSVNYYVGPSEVTILGLINQSNRSEIVNAILDLKSMRSVLQKKRQSLDTGDTSNGVNASTPDSQATTGQPTPTGFSIS